jgi:hypothetical protein
MASETAVSPGKGDLRWFLDLCIVGLTVVGKVNQLPSADGEKYPGQVKKEGLWQAMGMKVSWCDTELGQHGKFNDAKRAVEAWYRELAARKVEAQKAKLPCNVHANFRAGCVMCERANER